jgi:hypothetical protein
MIFSLKKTQARLVRMLVGKTQGESGLPHPLENMWSRCLLLILHRYQSHPRPSTTSRHIPRRSRCHSLSRRNTYEFRLITDVHYYWVDWYVKAPWETSERGTHIEGQLGDGETTESTFSYTFPSGAMHTGDFLITAVIYRGTDMSQYEETYTATVSLE